MTVTELIELLQELHPNTEVYNCQVVLLDENGPGWRLESIGTDEHFAADRIPMRGFTPRHTH